MIECASQLIRLQKKIIKLLNLNYVSNFIINVIANNIFVNKKFYFNTTHNCFYKNDIFVVFVSRINVHYVFKNNKIFEKIKSFVIIVRKNFISK